MSSADPIAYRGTLDEYQREAEGLFHELKSGNENARWRFKWEHPRFRGKHVREVDPATLDLGDAQVVVAHQYGFDTWADVTRFCDAVSRDMDNVAASAGLGLIEETGRLLPGADSASRHVALALAAQHGHVAIVKLLLEAGEDPNRYNPDGFHGHSTPLHQAVWADHLDVVRLLVERGARLDIQDTIYDGTPLGWAIHGDRTAIADYLREQTK